MNMDSLASGGVGASIILVLGFLYKLLNHKRVRSTCCGRKLEVSLDIEATTPAGAPVVPDAGQKAVSEPQQPVQSSDSLAETPGKHLS